MRNYPETTGPITECDYPGSRSRAWSAMRWCGSSGTRP